MQDHAKNRETACVNSDKGYQFGNKTPKYLKKTYLKDCCSKKFDIPAMLAMNFRFPIKRPLCKSEVLLIAHLKCAMV